MTLQKDTKSPTSKIEHFYLTLLMQDRNVPNFLPVHGDRLRIFLPVASIIRLVQLNFFLMAKT